MVQIADAVLADLVRRLFPGMVVSLAGSESLSPSIALPREEDDIRPMLQLRQWRILRISPMPILDLLHFLVFWIVVGPCQDEAFGRVQPVVVHHFGRLRESRVSIALRSLTDVSRRLSASHTGYTTVSVRSSPFASFVRL